MRGKGDGLRAERCLEDVLLVSAGSRAVVLRRAQHAVFRPVGEHVHLLPRVARQVVPEKARHEVMEAGPPQEGDEPLPFPERLEELIFPQVKGVKEAKDRAEGCGVGVRFEGEEHHGALDRPPVDPPSSRAVNADSRARAHSHRFFPLIVRNVCEHLRNAVPEAQGKGYRAHVIGPGKHAASECEFGGVRHRFRERILFFVRIAPAVAGSEAAAKAVNRQVEEEEVRHDLGTSCNNRIVTEVDQIEKRGQVLVVVDVREPLVEARPVTEVEPLEDAPPRALRLLASAHAGVGKDRVRKERSRKELIRREHDLVILRPRAHGVDTRLIRPVLESEHGRLRPPENLRRQERRISELIEDPDDAEHDEIRAVVPFVDVVEGGGNCAGEQRPGSFGQADELVVVALDGAARRVPEAVCEERCLPLFEGRGEADRRVAVRLPGSRISGRRRLTPVDDEVLHARRLEKLVLIVRPHPTGPRRSKRAPSKRARS